MAENMTLVPDGFEVARDAVSGAVRLTFDRDGGTKWAVILSPSSLPALALKLEEYAQHGLNDATDPAVLKRVASRLTGQEVKARPGGGAVLTLHLELDGGARGLSIPVELPPRDLAHLMEQLSHHR